MALAELPAHHVARNAHLGEQSVHLRGSSGVAGPMKQHDQRKFRPAPSAINGMMKTTTETGDLGQLSSKPTPRTASSLSNASAMYNVGSSLPAQRPRNLDRRQPHGLGQPAYQPRQYSPDTTYSSGDSGRPEYPGGTYYEGPGQSTYEEHQAWSMTQRSYVSHSLANRHPPSSRMYDRRVLPPGSRPRSPFAYPTRLKRPGYRPSSPALADVYRSRYDLGPDSRSSSPASSHSRQRAPMPWQQQQPNHSEPVMRSFPAAPSHDYADYRYQSPASSQVSTPRPTSSLRSVTSWSRLPQAQSPTAGIWNLPGGSPSTPVFYDYSEGFGESHGYQHNPRGIINDEPVQASNINEAADTSMSDENSYMTELSAEATEHKPLLNRSSSQSQSTNKKVAVDGIARSFSDAISNRRNRFTTGSLLPQEQALKHAQDHAGRPASVPGPVAHASSNDLLRHHRIEPLSLEKFAKHNTGKRQEATSNDPVGEERSSPSTGSMCTAESNSRLVEEDADPETDEMDLRITPDMKTEIPNNPEMVDLHTQSLMSRHSSVCETHSVSNIAEIVSPTPERSILSQDSRQRFSRLLNIDDSLVLNEDVSDNPRHMHIQPDSEQYRQAIKEEVCENPRRRQCQQNSEQHRPMRTTQGSLYDHVTINTSILDDSGSEREHELSPSLMQTFGGRGRDTSKSISAQSSMAAPVAERAILSQSSNGQDREPQEPERIASSASPATDPTTSKPETIVRKGSRSPTAAQHRHAHIIGSTERLSIQDSKGLSAVPEDQRTVIAISPPATSDAPDLPFSFSPIIQYKGYEDSVSESGGEGSSHVKNTENTVAMTKPPTHRSTFASEKDSVTSSHGSRPWNDDCNYPWSDQLPDLAVSIPAPPGDTQEPTGMFPRFKLRIQRASNSSVGSTRLAKRRGSSDETSRKRNSGLFSHQVSTLKPRPKPRFSNSPGEMNSSHAIREAPLQTRFVEGFNLPSRISGAAGSPTITLSPPSPGQEVRSFFSDDSSQARQKASLRKRLSEFKSRRQSHLDSTGNIQVPERGHSRSVLGKPRSSDRLSRQSHRTAHSTHTVGSHFLRFRTVRLWWRRSEDKIRAWTSRIWKPSRQS